MDLVVIIVSVVVLCFGFVVLFGAPYVPTHSRQAEVALDLLNLKKGQMLLELGAGDGKVALMALRRGLRVTAVEINPLLCILIWFKTFAYRDNISIVCGNFWSLPWPEADGVYVFLLERYMKKLDHAVATRYRSIKLVSYVFEIPQKTPIRSKEGMSLYRYR